MTALAVRSAWSIEDQTDPEALRLWNAFADRPLGGTLDALSAILREDFPSFCALLLKVRPKGGGYVVPFLFNQVQRRIWREMCSRIAAGEPLWYVLLKFRQAGMSTFWCAWIFWQTWRQNDVNALIVAHVDATGEVMIQNFRVFYDELPEMFRPKLRDGNSSTSIPRDECYFADRRSGTTLHLAKVGDKHDPRGPQPSHVLETEHSSYPNPEALNGALLPSLPTFGSEARLQSSFVIEATPKGQNAFHDDYWSAKRMEYGDFRALFFPWFLFDEQYSAAPPKNWKMTDEESAERKRLTALRMEHPFEDGGGKPVTREQMWWRTNTIQTDFKGSADWFDQEYPSDDVTCWMLASKSVFREYGRYLLDCCVEADEYAAETWAGFTVNGRPVITKGPVQIKLLPEIIEKQRWKTIQYTDFEIHPHGKWKVWAPPQPGHKYCIGADPAIGLQDADPSAICVIDVTEARQVAEFCDTMGPERFAMEIAAAGYWYNQALLVPEINNIGYVVLTQLMSVILYPNMYRWPKWDEPQAWTKKRGWETNNRTKQLMVSAMITNIEDETIRIASRDLYAELSTFEQKQESDFFVFNAQKGRHDDRVMAFGLALAGIEQTPVLLVELNRKSGRMPSARDLHLSGAAPDIPATPLPKAIEAMINIHHQIPWNPISSDLVA